MKSHETRWADSSSAKICVIFPGALGDFICFLPALRALASTAPVDLFARTEFGAIAPRGVVVESLERPEIGQLFQRGPWQDERTRRFFRTYDRVYSWLGSRDANFVAGLGAVLGLRSRVFPFRPGVPGCHQTDHYLACLKLASDGDRRPLVELATETVRWADDFWTRHRLQSRRVLALAPGSGAREKNWPVESFGGVVEWWQRTRGGAVLVLLGPVEDERGGNGPLTGADAIAREMSLAQLAALLARADIYLGNDSGVSHLAAALDIRTVVLFGPSDPVQWAPRGAKVTLVRRGIDCSPCAAAAMKLCPHRACLTDLDPGDVIGCLAQLPEVVTLTR